jgi:hypothetical protein
VGCRQRHDERSRQPRQRRAVHRARHQQPLTIEATRPTGGRAQGARAGDDDR